MLLLESVSLHSQITQGTKIIDLLHILGGSTEWYEPCEDGQVDGYPLLREFWSSKSVSGALLQHTLFPLKLYISGTRRSIHIYERNVVFVNE